MKRRIAREKAMQALFQIDISGTEPNAAIRHVLEDEPENEYMNQLVLGTIEHKKQVDALIVDHLENWKLDRVSNVERNIIRIATYELLFCSADVPKNVVINEAIEIAKKYGDVQSGKFVNAILAKISRDQ
ncbi:transcription antitermination factor NusB [Bacillaceae bacterium Marseille-Q3522]|nr:transcription antitermination factor NusB [Bacillaceae bacterium Marseille-Q3522]